MAVGRAPKTIAQELSEIARAEKARQDAHVTIDARKYYNTNALPFLRKEATNGKLSATLTCCPQHLLPAVLDLLRYDGFFIDHSPHVPAGHIRVTW